ncbi:alpha-L-glutamate ligase [Exiguobacterium sp. SH3S2]|uniref:ATP-grasp domain-containing protein n=1 Tax=unclassified Exiguobacterium TaxID=2644629 RepID=UPI00103D0FAA|nr:MULTISPECIES: alpha-L-glutamate ligase [unclassified Exiguobacterium]TCI44882.1 alpha-L-glutamate ligase [Exiguobacterium sp. SH3S3]TCI60303.1 alpha-L-glutamate ligase [Exiguobacterium sp. SH3S2]TCI64234.1 alpha-L-glutamate ligase [Exiguobacterium sp. SH3S1]
MAKIHVLHENNEWTDHLVQRLEELSLPYELWHLDEGIIDIEATPPDGVFYNRMSASSHTRGHRYAPELTEGVLAWLEANGRTVFNGTRAIRLEVSKVNQYTALRQAGIRVPRTIAAVGKKQIIEAAEKLGMSPFITKHNRAGKGLGVQLFHSIEALKGYVYGPTFEDSVDGITLIQQYIEAPKPFITRCEFIGGKFLYAVRVDTSEGFELCPADACSIEDQFCPVGETPPAKFEIVDGFADPIIDQLEAFLATNNIAVAGIEIIEDRDGNVYAYDVNTNTNYNSDAEAQAGQYGMLELATFLGDALHAKTK